ncbi:heme biosynthesis protein HemY [Thiopseudomonas alkaliphila]|uniref:heme biosynthesis protein HemY n=1 Tax=Thiopseudomonas alkaliphila TaxID=1697053 RepID=UPI003570A0E0
MKRAYLFILLAIVIAAAVGVMMTQHTGYVLLAWKGYRFESSLWVFLAILAVIGVALYAIRLLLTMLLISAGVLNPWSNLNRRRRARIAAEKGMLELAEGRWETALRHLKLAARDNPQPLVYLLGAAQAAERLGHSEEAESYLEQALARQPKAELAVALTHAELQWYRDDRFAAQETLMAMQHNYPTNKEVLERLQHVLQIQEDWPTVLSLLPALRKAKTMTPEQLDELERKAWIGRIEQSCELESDQQLAREKLQQAWKQLSNSLRHDPAILAAYSFELHRLGSSNEAEQLLRQALKQSLNNRLIELYGRIPGSDLAKQLQLAESWLPQQPNNPILLRCLARLCVKNQLWGKAKDYFERSLQHARQAQTCVELAQLLGELGETQRSNQLFSEGLQLTAGGQQLPAPSDS